MGLKDLVVKFKKKKENHGKKLVATEYAQETTKVFEGRELEYEGFSLTFNTTDRIMKGSNSLQLCFKSADDRSTFVNTFLASPPAGNALYYTNLTRELHTKMASKKYDDAHLLLTMLPKCEIEAFTTSQRLPLINSLVDETTTDGLQEQLVIRLLEEYEDAHILEQAGLYRQLDLVRLFKSVDGAESDLLTFALCTMVERYRSVVKLPYGGTVAIQEISTGNIFTRYHIARDSVGAFQLTLDTNAAGYNTSYHNSEVVVPYTDIFSIFTVEGEALEIPYLLLLKGVVKKEEERTFRQMMVAVDVASLAFGVAELKLAFTATSNLAKAFRIALASADIMATAADVACNGEDNELCQDWQKVSGWVQLGLISATGADLLYQTLKKSSKLQNEVLRLGLTNKGDEFLEGFVGVVRRGNANEIADATTRIANHRMSINKPSSGNFGYVEGNINGNSIDNKLWSSGTADPITEPQIFDATEVGGWIRNTDSEYKMLNKLADDLGGVKGNTYPNITGEIKVISERTYCTSCQGVLQQFSEMFPNLKLILIDGVR
ncbi:deaminase domain-containing protein [Flagellimonas baculiformis]|uniref:deaminase domain-containing protein n=1 Tax=Flagellimonas baculiformis TaxID=3067310 RepID=UPI00296FE7B8|nr:deaminase domain-containing protein [Muricauda sp. D6]